MYGINNLTGIHCVDIFVYIGMRVKVSEIFLFGYFFVIICFYIICFDSMF